MKRTYGILVFMAIVIMFSNSAQCEIMNELIKTPYREGIDPNPEMFFENIEKMHTIVDGTVYWTQLLSPLKGTNPLFPEEKGAVLVDLKGVAHAYINPGQKTDIITLHNEQRIYYFYRGNGRIICNGKTTELRDGIGLLIPPDLDFTI